MSTNRSQYIMSCTCHIGLYVILIILYNLCICVQISNNESLSIRSANLSTLVLKKQLISQRPAVFIIHIWNLITCMAMLCIILHPSLHYVPLSIYLGTATEWWTLHMRTYAHVLSDVSIQLCLLCTQLYCVLLPEASVC